MVKSAELFIVALLALAQTSSALRAPFYEPNTWHSRSGIVHLFEWKWLDIARECEEFLAPKGYAAVQISPPTENLKVTLPNGDRPWWERYQPISYRLITRSGNEQEFEEMTRRCNAVGVRIYADIVINHMTADFPVTIGTNGSQAQSYDMYYPSVPFTTNNFHKPQCRIHNYNDPVEVRNCELEGLHDLDHSQSYVREQIIGMMNRLIDLGVAGFRVDAVKHMWPQEVLMMMEGTKYLNTKYGFAPNTKPFVFQEVIDYGEEPISHHEYTHIGRLIDFRHSKSISKIFLGGDQLRWLRNWGSDWNLVYGPVSVVFVDNHDNQREDNGYGPVLTYKRDKQYKMAVAFMLAFPNGIPRVMSSFKFDHKDQGPPMAPNGDLISPKFNNKGECINGYVCEHRWRQIAQMIGFRNSAYVADVENWWDNGNNQIAFSRGNKAFIAFNNEGRSLDETLQTGLPRGVYCDVISGEVHQTGRFCLGKSISVDGSGRARIVLHPHEEDGVLAIHEGSKIFTY